VTPAPAEVEGKGKSSGTRKTVAIVLAVFAVLLGVGSWLARNGGLSGGSSVAMTTPYQAVLLSNGSAYFGRLEGFGSAYPVLKEVFYVQSVQDPQTKAVSNILVKRGKEWHSPDRMILNANMIVLVEPVNPNSRVAQLISQAKNQ
jgi:hypothetical protein